MNFTNFRDSALLKVELGGPFVTDLVDQRSEGYVVVHIGHVEDSGPKRRRQQQILYNWTLPLNVRKNEQVIVTRTFEMLS
ncbi:hypothetical protein lerEdw1_016634, partial [Lerista edwardsae]